MTTQTDQAFRALIKKAVHSANDVRTKCNGDFKYIKNVIDEADIVFAVWTDPSARGGVGWLLVKGQRLLSTCASGGAVIPAKIAGVPCTDDYQAHALLEVAGERNGGLN
jgi:hypothetical protein